MKISVVILNWNRPDDTIAAVNSTLRQQFPSFDVLVWDNASSDDSRRILESHFGAHPRVKLVFSDANHGVAGGRNRAFKCTDGDVLLSLDSDAVFDAPDALSRVATFLESRPDAGAVSFEVKRPDGHLMWPFARPAETWRMRTFETIRVDGCAFAVRRELFEKSGGFAEHFSPYGAEDQHFAYKVIGLGFAVLYLPEVVVIHAFSMRGRTPTQFRMHVRNSLWVPMELFPMPHALLSAGKLGVSLLRDAMEQHRVSSFVAGAAEAMAPRHWRRRNPISTERWKYLRALVAEDKRLATMS